MQFWAFLLSAAWPLVKKVLLMLGVGFLTYEGLGLIAGQVQGAVISAWGQIPASMLQILSLSGFAEAVGITLGAISARVALLAVGRIGKVTA